MIWIRSQDKEHLVELNRSVIYYYDDVERVHEILLHGYSVGVYESKERCLEILEDIEDTLIARYTMDLYNNASSMFRGYGQEEIKKTIKKITIFEMPEK